MASISVTPTDSISWSDITPSGGGGQPFKGLAINADASLMASSDGDTFWTLDGGADNWTQQSSGPGTSAVAISDTAVFGKGPGINPAGLPTGPTIDQPLNHTNWQTITAASAIDPKTGANYSSILTAAARTYGLDPDAFARQIFQESSFNARAVGPTIPGGAALGLGQFTPATAAKYGIDPFNPTQALNTSALYMNSLIHDNYGNYGFALVVYVGAGLVLAAYLAGNTAIMPQAALNYVLNITGRTLAEWAVKGFKLIASDAVTAYVDVSGNSASDWTAQLPDPGAISAVGVAMGASGADAAAVGPSGVWVTRNLR